MVVRRASGVCFLDILMLPYAEVGLPAHLYSTFDELALRADSGLPIRMSGQAATCGTHQSRRTHGHDLSSIVGPGIS